MILRKKYQKKADTTNAGTRRDAASATTVRVENDRLSMKKTNKKSSCSPLHFFLLRASSRFVFGWLGRVLGRIKIQADTGGGGCRIDSVALAVHLLLLLYE